MVKLPKLTTDLTPAERLKLLDDAAPDTAAALANKETGGKPWEQADPKSKKSVALHIPGDIAAKLEFVYLKHEGRPSKTMLINKAISEFADKWLKDNGYM